jgi:hypothetical protein
MTLLDDLLTTNIELVSKSESKGEAGGQGGSQIRFH